MSKNRVTTGEEVVVACVSEAEEELKILICLRIFVFFFLFELGPIHIKINQLSLW
jgi:hypothetical protein